MPTVPWLQRPGETDRQYQVFEVFRKLGPGRTLLACYRSAYGKPTAREAPAWFRTWARENAWVERCRAWDAHVSEAERKAELDEYKRQAEGRVRAYGAIRGAAMTIVQRANLAKIGDRDARRLLGTAFAGIETANRGMRLEAGQPGEIIQNQQTGAGGGPVDLTLSLHGGPDDDLTARIARLLAEADPDTRDAILEASQAMQRAHDTLTRLVTADHPSQEEETP